MTRFDWTIEHKHMWVATYNPTGDKLAARTKAQLMSRINEYEKAIPTV